MSAISTEPSSAVTSIAPTDLAGRSPSSQHSGQKRKAAAAGIGSGAGAGSGNAGTNRVTKARFFSKRRAAKACQCCRARKVRCNVTEHGAPCTNCRLDEVECVVSEGRRRRKLPDIQKKDGSVSIILPECRKKEQPRRLSSHSSVIDWFDDDSNSDEHGHFSTDYYPGQRQDFVADANFPAGMTNVVDPALTAYSSSLLTEANQPFLNFPISQSPTVPLAIPKYVNPIPTRIGPDEIFYLNRKGALYVPSGNVLAEMLRCFVEFVHHSNPVIELHDFLAVIQSDGDGTDRVSLLVLQAVLYAGSAFVDMQHLRSIGYRTRKEARQHLYTKVKLLYELDYETDRQALVQALSLITDHYERPNDLKDAHYWLSLAVSIAKSLGLQQSPDEARINAKRAKLRKRLWWSLVARDRLIALGMRRPTLIKSEDYDVPPLTEDDLQFSPLPERIASMLNNCESARDATSQRQLALLYVQKVRLCCCIGNVLHETYCTTNESTNFETDKSNMMLRPRTIGLSSKEVRKCHKELHAWLDDLPIEIALKNDNDDNPSKYESVSLSRALLHMLFHAAVSALHRPQVLLNNNSKNNTGPTPPASPRHDDINSTGRENDMLAISRCSVRRSTSSITAIAGQLARSGLARYLPITGITVLVAAMVIHLLDLKPPTGEVSGTSEREKPERGKVIRAEALNGFCTCMSVMKGLSEKYPAADVSTVFLDAAVRRARIRPAALAEEMQNSERSVVANTNTEGETEEYVSSAAGLLAAGQRILGVAFVSDIPASPLPMSPAGVSSFTTQDPSVISASYPLRTTTTSTSTVNDPMRGRVTLSSLTPPPEESLPFASSLPGFSKHIAMQQQQQHHHHQHQQQKYINMAHQTTARNITIDKKYGNTATTTTIIDHDEIDMARRLERYLAGVPFSTSPSPALPAAPVAPAALPTAANQSSIFDSVATGNSALSGAGSENVNAGAAAAASAAAETETALPEHQFGDSTSGFANGTGIDGAAAFYGQLESDFDALIDMSAVATGTVTQKGSLA